LPPLWLHTRLFAFGTRSCVPEYTFKRDFRTLRSTPLHFGDPLLRVS
jgi:hypothetical protein